MLGRRFNIATVLMSFIMCGCGGDKNQAITSAQVFNLNMTGQNWVFQDGYGNHMFVAIENPPVGFYPGCSVWHYTKDNARAYWRPGAAGAELHFVLCQQPDGSWIGKASLVDMPPTLLTQNIEPAGDGKIPYLIIPAAARTGVAVSDDTAYTSYILVGEMTWNALKSTVTPTQKAWRTNASIESVVTPVYTGPALVSEQWEAWSAPCFPVEQPGCAHEKWYFAPNLGLVKVIPMEVSINDAANLTMIRIH